MAEETEAESVAEVEPGTVTVTLDDAARVKYAEEMASLVARIELEQEAAKKDAAEHKAEIEALREQLSKLAKNVREGFEQKSQMELRFPQAEAMRHLHDVAEHAGVAESAPS